MRQHRPRFLSTNVLVTRVLFLAMRQHRPRFSSTNVLVTRVLFLAMFKINIQI
ncbi:hypothetical protein QKQ66_gp075 [Dione juno nucleopolyhedrovirus]|uniref:Uncharacterized protein n=1 Tax=Dione juno nucleopolyhedrovirus TaxID=2594175 RepID=A0AAE6LC84_9ABAC|nr:hypothetical protein QKQ66_gp075 [Dione juno nucleopolyhedrovirus]QDL57040.1 hypothetical protein DijuNPV-ORF-75 [Dione juno nucleopolyhedrovirus]